MPTLEKSFAEQMAELQSNKLVETVKYLQWFFYYNCNDVHYAIIQSMGRYNSLFVPCCGNR